MTENSCQQLSSLNSTNENNTATATTTKLNQNHHNTDHYLKQLNKASHKISKPIKKPPLDHHHHHLHDQQQLLLQQQQQQQQQQNQPPVYNVNRSDFRNVVQKLTGSPAHERFSSTNTSTATTPPPIHPLKPSSSRLQRIRPPPLPLLSSSTSTAIPGNNPSNFVINNTISSNNVQKVTPLSPLPPFPSVHATAESPITAYMRYLRSSNPQQAVQQVVVPSPNLGIFGAVSSQFVMPNSPLGFGSLISPTLLLSPSTAQLGFPQLDSARKP